MQETEAFFNGRLLIYHSQNETGLVDKRISNDTKDPSNIIKKVKLLDLYILNITDHTKYSLSQAHTGYSQKLTI